MDELKNRAQEEGATHFMILLAAFKTLLYRHTGRTDLIVGVPVANRPREEAEPLIGFFVNTLVLQTALRTIARFGNCCAASRRRLWKPIQIRTCRSSDSSS